MASSVEHAPRLADELERAVPVRGGEVAAWRRNGRDPALVLHGAWTATDYTAPLVESLPARLATIRYQQRALLTVEGHVDDAIAVLDAFTVERALLVGHSWGGYLALRVATAHPDRVNGVVALGTLGARGDGGLRTLAETIERRLSPAEEAALGALGGDPSFDDAFPLCWRAYFARPESAPAFPTWLRVEDASSRLLAASVAEELASGVLAAALGSLACPVLFVHGAHDPLPVSAAIETAALVPRSRVHVLEDCGHFPWLEQPEAVRAAVDGGADSLLEDGWGAGRV